MLYIKKLIQIKKDIQDGTKFKLLLDQRFAVMTWFCGGKQN